MRSSHTLDSCAAMITSTCAQNALQLRISVYSVAKETQQASHHELQKLIEQLGSAVAPVIMQLVLRW